MQDYLDQAAKNGVVILPNGRCQCCGADYERGIAECIDTFNSIELVQAQTIENLPARFLRVDAHALQHPEIHGRWSNHFHLTRLHLILKKNIVWNYKLSPLLSKHINAYKLTRPDEYLIPPPPMRRGNITSLDILKASQPVEYSELIFAWANEVYEAWDAGACVAAYLADGFRPSIPSGVRHLDAGHSRL